MAGHMYVNANLSQIKHIGVCKGSNVVQKIKKAYVWKNGAYHQVWSGASLVKYYDGSLLLETKEIDEGNDVLGAYTPSKTNNDFVGWSLTKGGSKLNTLKATGEPIALYAIYKPYSMVTYVYPTGTSTPVKVYAGSDVLHPSGIPTVSNQTHVGWIYSGSRTTSLTATGSNMTITAVYVPNSYEAVNNTSYVTGTKSVSTGAIYAGNQKSSATVSFSIAFGDYTACTARFDIYASNEDVGYLEKAKGYIDGAETSWGSMTWDTNAHRYFTKSLGAGSHTMRVWACSYDYYEENATIYLTSVSLSSPRRWT